MLLFALSNANRSYKLILIFTKLQ